MLTPLPWLVKTWIIAVNVVISEPHRAFNSCIGHFTVEHNRLLSRPIESDRKFRAPVHLQLCRD